MPELTQMNIWDKHVLRSDDIILGMKYNYARRDFIIGGPRKFRSHITYIFEHYLPSSRCVEKAYGYNNFRMQTKLSYESYKRLLKALKEIWQISEQANFKGILR